MINLGGQRETESQEDGFEWDAIWEEDCLAVLHRAQMCSGPMDKAPLEQVGTGLDATYIRLNK